MRGCFRVVYAKSNKREFKVLNDYTTGTISGDTYIPFSQISRIQHFGCCVGHRDFSLFQPTIIANDLWNTDDYPHAYYVMLFNTIERFDEDKKFKRCTCLMAKEAKAYDQNKTGEYGRVEDCECDLDIFPLYEITVKDGETYLLHPEDRPAIEAYIQGVDTMAELVHELRWNPEINIGRKKRTKEDFEEKVKGI